MRRYAVSGLAADTLTTIDHVLFGLWNPSANRRIGITRMLFVKNAGAGVALPLAIRRNSTQGTPGTTVTPTIVNDYDRNLAPPSGSLLGLSAYSVQPTLEALILNGWWAPWGIGASYERYFDPPLWINPGAGVTVSKSTTGVFGGGRVTVEWIE